MKEATVFPSSGQKIGEAGVLERRLDWPWLLDVWLVRKNGDRVSTVAGIVPKAVTFGSTVYAELKAATLRVESVKHPFILPIQQWVEEDGMAAIVSAHAEARGLRTVLQEKDAGFFEVAEIKEWVAQLGLALDDAHEAGLVHGWLSVQDLVVTPDSDLMVANFGITRMLAGAGVADERMLAVASPQAMGGEPSSISDDVYGLGSVIFELVTGTPVFVGPGVSQKVLEEVPETMQARREKHGRVGWEIPAFWEEVVADCLAKDAAKRPKRASDVARLLGIGMKPHPIALAGDGARISAPIVEAAPALGNHEKADRSGRGPTRNAAWGKWALAAILLVLVGIAVGAVILGIAHLPSREHAENPQPPATAAAAVAPVPKVIPPTKTPVAVLPTATAVASASPAQTATVLPENLPSLESMAKESPTIAPAPSASPSPVVAVAASPAVELALNQLPTPTSSPIASPSESPSATPEPSPAATKATAPTFTNSLGMKFVAVGDVKFSIWETRLSDFTEFAKETNLRPGLWKQPGFAQGSDHPVVYVSWDDAMAFCKWLTQKDLDAGLIKTSEVYRLPTDLEWSKAVGLPPENGDTPENRDMGVPDVYPWGTQWPPPPGAGNYTGEETGSDVAIRGYNDGFSYTAPVGSFQPNTFGLYDMGGNAWEWCMDFWNPARKYRVLRGGSWYNGALKLSLLSSCRVNALQDSSTDNFGFRVVLAPINSLPASSR